MCWVKKIEEIRRIHDKVGFQLIWVIKPFEGRIEIFIKNAETTSPPMCDNTFDENIELLFSLFGILTKLDKLIEKRVTYQTTFFNLPCFFLLGPEQDTTLAPDHRHIATQERPPLLNEIKVTPVARSKMLNKLKIVAIKSSLETSSLLGPKFH